MRSIGKASLGAVLLIFSLLVQANSKHSTRIPLLANSKVSVWKTVIYPDRGEILPMHRHEHNRVVVALDSGTLKIKNNQGQEHYLKLQKNQAYYLTKDKAGELHTDENISGHPIKVIVMELKK